MLVQQRFEVLASVSSVSIRLPRLNSILDVLAQLIVLCLCIRRFHILPSMFADVFRHSAYIYSARQNKIFSDSIVSRMSECFICHKYVGNFRCHCVSCNNVLHALCLHEWIQWAHDSTISPIERLKSQACPLCARPDPIVSIERRGDGALIFTTASSIRGKEEERRRKRLIEHYCSLRVSLSRTQRDRKHKIHRIKRMLKEVEQRMDKMRYTLSGEDVCQGIHNEEMRREEAQIYRDTWEKYVQGYTGYWQEGFSEKIARFGRYGRRY
mmetsp:Transcript_7610/g.28529  ORF Transcript_7610/g.28529 Transcript_7610/m.28529 type:complete len:268 (-) Transcript_7610:69-872(-)